MQTGIQFSVCVRLLLGSVRTSIYKHQHEETPADVSGNRKLSKDVNKGHDRTAIIKDPYMEAEVLRVNRPGVLYKPVEVHVLLSLDLGTRMLDENILVTICLCTPFICGHKSIHH